MACLSQASRVWINAAWRQSFTNHADVSKDDAKDFITEKFGAETFTDITNSVWKKRLEALTTIQEGLSSLDLKADGARLCLSLCHIPGWKDSNFQVCLLCSIDIRSLFPTAL
jgi:hypothetical protein